MVIFGWHCSQNGVYGDRKRRASFPRDFLCCEISFKWARLLIFWWGDSRTKKWKVELIWKKSSSIKSPLESKLSFWGTKIPLRLQFHPKLSFLGRTRRQFFETRNDQKRGFLPFLAPKEQFSFFRHQKRRFSFFGHQKRRFPFLAAKKEDILFWLPKKENSLFFGWQKPISGRKELLP